MVGIRRLAPRPLYSGALVSAAAERKRRGDPLPDRAPARFAVEGAAWNAGKVVAGAHRGAAGEIIPVARVDKGERSEQVKRFEHSRAPGHLGAVTCRAACVLERVSSAG